MRQSTNSRDSAASERESNLPEPLEHPQLKNSVVHVTIASASPKKEKHKLKGFYNVPDNSRLSLFVNKSQAQDEACVGLYNPQNPNWETKITTVQNYWAVVAPRFPEVKQDVFSD
jgi:AMMECR1 domain-containing protein